MASKTVEWTSFNRLACAGCTPADILLCTTYDVVLPASLVSFQTFNNGCGGKFYRYVFNYDTADLPEGVTGLTCATITGAVCKGCLTQWVEQQDTAIEEQITLLEEQVALDIDAARPLIFSDQTSSQGFSFLADPTAVHDVDLVIANPSLTRPLEVDIAWGWSVILQASGPFVDTGALGRLYIDGSLIPITSSMDASALWAVAGTPALLDFAGPGGHYHTTVAAGASITARLRMTSSTVGAPTPDIAWGVENMYVSAFGVTS